MATIKQQYAYCTLITRSSYLAGVIILAHTLKKYNTAYPLIVLYTDQLPASSIRALEIEAPRTNLILRRVSALLPRENVHVHLIAERFADTWTKLRVFELYDLFDSKEGDTSHSKPPTVCYLDADMILCQNMDSIFTHTPLPADDWIAANHACVCNLDADPWAPAEWTKENCAYTPLYHPSALTHPTPVTPDSRPTHHLLNSGMFLFRPSSELWDRMLHFFNTTPLLGEFKFPDQDFLAEFFRNKWVSTGWQFNALKTMRYWHGNIWRDDSVVCLHYIVDKPWARRIGADGTAGYLGRDGVTHGWWWQEWEEWSTARQGEGNKEAQEVVEITRGQVAKPLRADGEHEEEDDEDMRAIGAGVQAFAKNKKPASEDAEGDRKGKDTGAAEGEAGNEAETQNAAQDDDGDAEDGQASSLAAGQRHGKKVLGERGHGARAR